MSNFQKVTDIFQQVIFLMGHTIMIDFSQNSFKGPSGAGSIFRKVDFQYVPDSVLTEKLERQVVEYKGIITSHYRL